MRSVINDQMILGETSIPSIQFDLSTRDEIPQLLMGLQYIYTNKALYKTVFEHLEQLTPPDVDPNIGRAGMNYWTVLVFGTLRLVCNIDYDCSKNLLINT